MAIFNAHRPRETDNKCNEVSAQEVTTTVHTYTHTYIYMKLHKSADGFLRLDTKNHKFTTIICDMHAL